MSMYHVLLGGVRDMVYVVMSMSKGTEEVMPMWAWGCMLTQNVSLLQRTSRASPLRYGIRI